MEELRVQEEEQGNDTRLWRLMGWGQGKTPNSAAPYTSYLATSCRAGYSKTPQVRTQTQS